MGLCVGQQGLTAIGHRGTQTHGGQHIVQRLARAGVHQHTARCHQRHTGTAGAIVQLHQPPIVISRLMQHHAQPQTVVLIIKNGPDAFHISTDSY
jgi:hypothetical protein